MVSREIEREGERKTEVYRVLCIRLRRVNDNCMHVCAWMGSGGGRGGCACSESLWTLVCPREMLKKWYVCMIVCAIVYT